MIGSRYQAAGAFLALGSCAGPAVADITFSATVRDFTPQTNPDFESVIATDRGIVATTLGGDGKPVYAGGVHPTITSAASFNQWYRNVPGVNIALPTTLTLTESTPGVFSYVNNAYFPIDGQGFGNYDSTGHNYHFTTELHARFVYQPGQFFDFTGDDDVWVYLNNKLAIDLGGTHAADAASVNLDTLGLTAGTEYPLDLFQAERHTFGSTFSIVSNISPAAPEPAGLAAIAAGGAALSRRRRRA